MKTIKELRTVLNFHPQEINSILEIFARNSSIDFDVYLPSKGMNLQRGLVWSLQQKRELIWSILMNRKIPRLALMNVIIDEIDIDGVYQVIDGKQRLSTMIEFLNNKFTLEIDRKEYFMRDLPIEYQRVIKGYPFAYYIANEPIGKPFSDQDKIDWFKYINFAGTPQDLEHFKRLKSNE
jgi:uncharacterized protein with ParB-like and HNH nuclease domain